MESKEVKVSCLFGGGIRQVPQSPEAVLDKALARVSQVEPQGLHASCTDT